MSTKCEYNKAVSLEHIVEKYKEAIGVGVKIVIMKILDDGTIENISVVNQNNIYGLKSSLSADSDEFIVTSNIIGVVTHYALVSEEAFTQWVFHTYPIYLERNRKFNGLCPCCSTKMDARDIVYTNRTDVDYYCPICKCTGEYNPDSNNLSFDI